MELQVQQEWWEIHRGSEGLWTLQSLFSQMFVENLNWLSVDKSKHSFKWVSFPHQSPSNELSWHLWCYNGISSPISVPLQRRSQVVLGFIWNEKNKLWKKYFISLCKRRRYFRSPSHLALVFWVFLWGAELSGQGLSSGLSERQLQSPLLVVLQHSQNPRPTWCCALCKPPAQRREQGMHKVLLSKLTPALRWEEFSHSCCLLLWALNGWNAAV